MSSPKPGSATKAKASQEAKPVTGSLGERGPAQAKAPKLAAASEFPFLVRLLLSVCGGCAVFLSFPTFDLWPLAYVALVPLLFAVRDRTPWRAFGWGALFGFVTNLGGFYWISGLLRDFGHMASWLAWLICLLLVAYQGLVFALWAASIVWIRRHVAELPLWSVALPSMIAIEFVFPMLFPWYYGNSQYLFLPAVQIADIFGVLGVTAELLLVNLAVYQSLSWWLARRRRGEATEGVDAQPHGFPRRFVASAALIVVLVLVYGLIRIAMVEAQMEAAPKLRIGMVEANIGIWEKENPEKLDNNILLHQHGSADAVARGAELVVWPESSYQSPFIWGSTLQSDDVTLLEADSLFVPRLRELVMPALRLMEAGFGQPLYRYSSMQVPFHAALARVAEQRKLGTLHSAYPYVCGEQSQSYLRCPYRRVAPDDISFLLPGYEPLQADFRADRKAGTLPWNQLAVQRGFRTPLLFGSVTIRSSEGVNKSYQELLRAPREERDLYNVALLLDEYGRVRGNYHKVYLLLFGETIPFAEHFPKIYDLIPEAGSFTAGRHAQVFEYEGLRMGMMVCYEDIIPVFSRQLAQLEPQVLINVTNDAWFGKTSEPYLHFALATLRSVESRVWLVRSTNTGVSAFVDATGRIRSQTSIEDAETLVEDVDIMSGSKTVYTRIGDVLGWVSLGVMCFLAVLRRVRRRERELATDTASA